MEINKIIAFIVLYILGGGLLLFDEATEDSAI